MTNLAPYILSGVFFWKEVEAFKEDREFILGSKMELEECVFC